MNGRTVDEFPEVATRAEVSRFTGIAVKTLANWSTAGIGPRPTVLGNRVRYRKRDVLDWLDQNRVSRRGRRRVG